MTEAANKRIGILFGMEDTFPWALMNEINTLATKSGDAIECGPVKISHLTQEQSFEDSVILDRISHEVPFYRTFLKCAVARGVDVVNNPIWWSADDKFFDNVVALAAGVAVPKKILPQPGNGGLGPRVLLPRLPDLPEARERGRLEGRLQVRHGRRVLRRVRQDTGPRDDGAGGDRVHGLLSLLRRGTQARAHHGICPERAAPSPLCGGARQGRARGDGRTCDGGGARALRRPRVRPQHRGVRRARRRTLRDRLHEIGRAS